MQFDPPYWDLASLGVRGNTQGLHLLHPHRSPAAVVIGNGAAGGNCLAVDPYIPGLVTRVPAGGGNNHPHLLFEVASLGCSLVDTHLHVEGNYPLRHSTAEGDTPVGLEGGTPVHGD